MAGIRNSLCLTVLNSIVDACDTGSGTASAHVAIYSGTAPAQCDAALSGNTKLADLTCANPAFGSATDTNPGGTAAAATISDDTDADATGNATFLRILDRDGNAQLQLSCSISGDGGEVIFNSVVIQQHARVTITALSITQPES